MFVLAGAHEARSRGMWIVVTYQPSIAVGKTGDFVSEPGYIGFGGEWRSFRDEHLAWSLSGSWNNFYETTDELIQIDNVTISGTQVRYLDFVPILVGIDYHFLSKRSRIRPYVSLASGAYWARQRMEIGSVNLIMKESVHVGVTPGLGITFLTPDLDIYGFVSSDFNYILSREDSIDYTYVTLNIGFVYLL